MQGLRHMIGVALALLAPSVKASSCNNKGKSLTVATTSGEVSGFINSTAPQVRQFLGIPYAEAPLNSLRFQPPQPKKDAGPINATSYPPACMQQISTAPTVYSTYMQQFLINGGQSEDCLYVNVYAPLHPTGANLPVFIYVPGGGFTTGGSNSLYKIPDQWIQRTQSHIVVIMNYRLNLFGFPNAEGAHQNVGLLDQRAVVEWTRDNIAAFGGNPEQMVLWGQSAGAASVGHYGYTYPNDLIVKGLISDSGAPSILSKTFGNFTSFSTLAGLVGCGDLDATGELECMQKVDAQTLESVSSNHTSIISFSPVADNVTAFSNTTDRLANGLVAKVPWIMGSNANEGAGFGTFNASGMSEAQFQIGLSAITCPVVKEIKAREQFGYSTYQYFYSGNFSNISPLPWIGATHSSELPLLFGTHYLYRGNSTEFEWETSYGMEALWLSFASNPETDPIDGQGVTWPKYRSNTSSMAQFAADDRWIQGRVFSILEMSQHTIGLSQNRVLAVYRPSSVSMAHSESYAIASWGQASSNVNQMAPSIAEFAPGLDVLNARADAKLSQAFDSAQHASYKYRDYLPVYDETTTFPATEPFEFSDRGHLADAAKPNLLDLKDPNVQVTKLTPRVGTEFRGVQLSQLTDTQKNELALLIAERGVVVFRDQDFKDIGVQKQKEFGEYFGRLHVHPVGAHVEGALEFHNIYLGPDNLYRAQLRSSKLSTTGYHSDVSYEHQPPGITILTLLAVPSTGGDTGWTSQVAAYERLSKPIKLLLEGLRAEHSGFPQADNARRDGKHVRREPVKSDHPIVRVHPVTGQKALFVNPGFTKKIIGLKDEESDAILQLLFKHISQSQDVQVRVKWEEGTVALWDNRVTAHTAISDYDVYNEEEGLRHGFRITTLGEKPAGVDGLETTW
ncbi:uncharacterized protein JN550_003195 [Neoarthrinium moseri]|uniref:uncharacterized protein n=1 Tax=Neoarthrinium moseri TaxID=1658444 RepID=UPI001FDBD1C5|nr:uncharacterized protein JN550_003195 [Neoarthrinium moseri]KAI1873926.1 hypothetical protein JN550_003195 [Neoarthrinium moseri]